jgi:uncharacterized membrane protein
VPRIGAGAALRVVLLFSFGGWMVDSAYRSFSAGELVLHGPTLPPFYPSYGLGALILAWVIPRVRQRPLPVRAALYAAVTTGWELCAGLVLGYGLSLRLWDYSDSSFQLLGLVDLEHSAWWTLLALFGERYLYPLVQRHILEPEPPGEASRVSRGTAAEERPTLAA